MDDILIYSLGFLAQLMFSGRVIVQWFVSEKAGQVLSPTLFWKLSLIGSCMMIIYGVLRKDIVIIAGQSLSYYIYIRNLHLKDQWKLFPNILQWTIVVLPVLSIGFLLLTKQYNFDNVFFNEEISSWLLVVGTVGQSVFVSRFVYQWIVSEKRKESVLPLGFWLLALGGSIMILIYGIYREDPVLIAGHTFGMIVYIRNIMIGIKADKKLQNN
ncbi:MAG: lauroyl acyltransferase [Bacteroidia bacterium]|nr:lauroyl acyltransferase [Bacteroidia bacterium]